VTRARMIKLELLLALATLALWIFSLEGVIGSDDGRVRHLPKVWWLLIVLFFPLAGPIAWLVAGRPESGDPRSSPTSARLRSARVRPSGPRPGCGRDERSASV
jgi:hypothetical protein